MAAPPQAARITAANIAAPRESPALARIQGRSTSTVFQAQL